MTPDEPTTPDAEATAGTAAGEEPGPVRRVYRSVSTRSGGHGDTEMDAIGWGLFLGLVFLLLPLLPVIVVVWLVSKVAEALARR